MPIVRIPMEVYNANLINPVISLAPNPSRRRKILTSKRHRRALLLFPMKPHCIDMVKVSRC